MTDAERIPWLGDRTMRLLCAAMDRDADEVTRLLDEIAQRYDAQGIWGICYALAGAIHKLAFPAVQRGDGTLTGDMLVIDRIPGASTEDPDALWAARFVVAYVNGDADTANALFYGTMADPNQHAGGVIALIAMAADIARQREAEGRAAS